MTNRFPLAPYVRSFFEDYLSCRRNVSRNTIKSYRDALKLLLRFAAERLRKAVTRLGVIDLTEAVITAFLTDLERARGNAIQTRNHRLVAIRSLFEYIAAREPLALGHCHKIMTIPKKRGALRPEIGYLERTKSPPSWTQSPETARWAAVTMRYCYSCTTPGRGSRRWPTRESAG